MIKFFSPSEVVELETMMSMPDSKIKLVCLEKMRIKYKSYFPFCAYKSNKLVDMIKYLRKKYG